MQSVHKLNGFISQQVSCMAMCMMRRRDLRDKQSSLNYWQSMLLTSHGYVKTVFCVLQ